MNDIEKIYFPYRMVPGMMEVPGQSQDAPAQPRASGRLHRCPRRPPSVRRLARGRLSTASRAGASIAWPPARRENRWPRRGERQHVGDEHRNPSSASGWQPASPFFGHKGSAQACFVHQAQKCCLVPDFEVGVRVRPQDLLRFRKLRTGLVPRDEHVRLRAHA